MRPARANGASMTTEERERRALSLRRLNRARQHLKSARDLLQEVVLTGAGPVWLYLKIAHALHGKAKKLVYRSPVTGDVVIFDHDPF